MFADTDPAKRDKLVDRLVEALHDVLRKRDEILLRNACLVEDRLHRDPGRRELGRGRAAGRPRRLAWTGRADGLGWQRLAAAGAAFPDMASVSQAPPDPVPPVPVERPAPPAICSSACWTSPGTP